MKFEIYKNLIHDLPMGKRLPDALYVHARGLSEAAPELWRFVSDVALKADVSNEYNVFKLSLSQFRISFLFYPDFMENPHPVLRSSVIVNLATGKIRKFDYSGSDNPPILHRKETLLQPGHPLIPKFEALTRAEEKAGLYENPRVAGGGGCFVGAMVP